MPDITEDTAIWIWSRNKPQERVVAHANETLVDTLAKGTKEESVSPGKETEPEILDPTPMQN